MSQVTERTIDDWLAEKRAVFANMPEGRQKVLVSRDIDHVHRNRSFYLSQSEPAAYFCKECGKPERPTYVAEFQVPMVEKQICFACELWNQRLNEHKVKPSVIFNGVLYSIGPEPKKGERCDGLGFGGATWYLKHLASGRLIVTSNLWCGGDIPQEFIDKGMHDTYQSLNPLEGKLELSLVEGKL